MNWIFVVALIAGIVILYKLKHVKHKFFLMLGIIAILLVYVTALQALSNQDIDWKSIGGIEKGTKLYFAWLSGAFDNVKTITANVAKMEWSSNDTQEDVRLEER